MKLLTAPRLPADLRRVIDERLGDEVEWSEVEVTGDFTGTTATAVVVSAARLASVRLAGATLERVRMTDVVADGCDFSGALLDEAHLTRVEFRRCRMSGVVMTRGRLRDVRFVGCRADDANLRMTAGERVHLEDVVLRGADFGSVKWSGARFFDCDLTGASFTKADLAGARLHGSRLDEVRGGAGLKGVVIDGAQVVPLAEAVFRALGIAVDGEREA